MSTSVARSELPVTPIAPQRDARGRLLPGNTIAASHGLFSERDLANLREEVSEFLNGSIADDGGESEVSVRRRSLHQYRARVHRRIAQLDDALEAKGLFDRRGKLRVQWVTKLETLIATAKALDSLLGLERRARRLPSSPTEYLQHLENSESLNANRKEKNENARS